jgi:hypothetical protein
LTGAEGRRIDVDLSLSRRPHVAGLLVVAYLGLLIAVVLFSVLGHFILFLICTLVSC